MANETENTKPENTGGQEQPKHESWLKHVVDEIKEEIEELTEEAQNMGGDFLPLGNGHVNVVHDHRHDNDEEKKKD